MKALAYVLSEYDSQVELVDRTANTLPRAPRVGGIMGLIARLLSVYAGVQKGTGAWPLPLLAMPLGFALGGVLGMGRLMDDPCLSLARTCRHPHLREMAFSRSAAVVAGSYNVACRLWHLYQKGLGLNTATSSVEVRGCLSTPVRDQPAQP